MATTASVSTDLQLQPYIFLYGRCEEALEFYKTVFGGTYELMRVKDTPVKDQFGPGLDDKVMHASFKSPSIAFLAADGREAKSVDPDAGNVSLALSTTNAAEGERIFKALSQGGEVKMPLDDAFWGGRFGMLHDRFGTEWLITLP
ncbi:MAG: VOC family protein [Candidatus Eremiobacteraeota bacterium]|nr:VOC family protein [Candidatus Eremiobacteraeota bacterium]